VKGWQGKKMSQAHSELPGRLEDVLLHLAIV
jgi:hypothetical protein